MVSTKYSYNLLGETVVLSLFKARARVIIDVGGRDHSRKVISFKVKCSEVGIHSQLKETDSSLKLQIFENQVETTMVILFDAEYIIHSGKSQNLFSLSKKCPVSQLGSLLDKTS